MSIAKNLNALPGARKAWTEWRKTWQDMKSAAKKKRMARRELMEAHETKLEDPETLGDKADAIQCVMRFEDVTEDDLERTLISLVREHRSLWHPGDPGYCGRRLARELWAAVARQLSALSGGPWTPEQARQKWLALRERRATGLRGTRASEQGDRNSCKQEDLMSFLDDVDEFSEQYSDASALKEDPIQEDPLEHLENTQHSPAELEDRKPSPPPSPPERPKKKRVNRQRVHQRTIRRFKGHGLDLPNSQEVTDDSDDEAILKRRMPEAILKRPTQADGHTHFCLSLAPLMRSLPLVSVVGVRIKILQLLRDAMAVE